MDSIFSLTRAMDWIAASLLAAIIPVFALAVTLLGEAIQRAKQQEDEVQSKQKAEFQQRLSTLEGQLKEAKESGQGAALEKELGQLKRSGKVFTKQIERIKKRRSLLTFANSVAYPGTCFIAVLLLDELTRVTEWSPNNASNIFSLSVLLLCLGIYRLSRCLVYVQEVSLDFQAGQERRLTGALTAALFQFDKANEPELLLTFRGEPFPRTCSVEQELEIRFSVEVAKGKIAQDAKVRFFMPESFTAVQPNRSWSQDPSFKYPNARTVEVSLGKINVSSRVLGTLKIKCPKVPGAHVIAYDVIADSYNGPYKEIQVVVVS